MKNRQIKYKLIGILIVTIWLSIISIGWMDYYRQQKKLPEFTRITEYKQIDNYYAYNSYSEIILVQHSPYGIEPRSEMIMEYYDSVGLSLEQIRDIGDSTYYYMEFHKHTRETEEYFLEKKPFSNPLLNQNCIGWISISENGRKVSLSLNTGKRPFTDSYKEVTYDLDIQYFILMDEDNPDFVNKLHSQFPELHIKLIYDFREIQIKKAMNTSASLYITSTSH